MDSGLWSVLCGLWSVDCGLWGSRDEKPRAIPHGTLFRAARGRASGRVTAIRVWQTQHYPRTPNFLTVHCPLSTVHCQCSPYAPRNVKCAMSGSVESSDNS